MRPPPSESQKCRKCLRPCFPGHRRRDPFGAYYCASCGNNVHYVIRKALENNGLLQYFVVAIPGFLRYVPPAIIGLGDLYIGARFNYVPPPDSLPCHPPRSRDFPQMNCFACEKLIPKKASSSRRGNDPNVVYCSPCGWKFRRWLKRARFADACLKTAFREAPSVCQFLRPDILAWLEKGRVDRLLETINRS